MKKIFCVFSLIILLSLCITSCEPTVPRPKVKEGRFDIIVTYEHNGELREASAVYVCEYDGIDWANVNGERFVKWKESFEGDVNESGVIPICNTDDGGEIFISLLLYPEYFMGDPEYADHTPIIRAELWYPDGQIDDAELIAEYGVKLIGCEYDEPIKNSYK